MSSWIKQPKVFKVNEETGEDVPNFGLNLCGAAIGDYEYMLNSKMWPP
jgi:hypothetical protein